METMVGKLVNFDTDIDTHRPINDSETKKIVDRVPRRIRRKNRTDISGTLPGIHLFAANNLPKSLDGAAMAYERRIIVMRCNSWTAPEDAPIDFEQDLFAREKGGIISCAVEGLKDLLEQGGTYSIPPSSRVEVKKMQTDSDPVQQFLDEISEGDGVLIPNTNSLIIVEKNAEIERKNLWEAFKLWSNGQNVMPVRITKRDFYHNIILKGYGIKKNDSVRSFIGIGEQVPGGQKDVC